MGGLRCRTPHVWVEIWTLLIWMVLWCSHAQADDTQWIEFTNADGTTAFLNSNREPALYTGDFGDCQGDSLINVTRFDASMYRDNMTVMFHMSGTSALENEHIMMYFSVFAYGENRFNLTFNPCNINIPSLCPINSSIPVEANGVIPIGPSDIAGIPSIAFGIPDFEGQAIIRLFSNTTETQIACYSAKMTNGHSFSHPAAVGSVLGVFTLVALVSSAAVTVYGQLIPETRKHYAHTVSVFVVFSVLQHVFLTGGLSMNWPSVLVAFWSNYAWSAGMIYSRKMQNSINNFIGGNRGNISMVGSAPSNQNFADLGGGYSLSQLYKRDGNSINQDPAYVPSVMHKLQRRELDNKTTGFLWYGNPVAPGLPLPGNYSGIAGTLAEIDIPASNAFLTGLLWFLILVAIVAFALVITKCIVEGLARFKRLRTGRLDFFRSHWIRFVGIAILRTCFIAFFMMTYFTLFQFTLGGATGVIAIAAVVFSLFFLGLFGVAFYATWYRVRPSKFRIDVDKLQVVTKRNGRMKWYGVSRESVENLSEEPKEVVKDFPWLRPHLVDSEEALHVHDDDSYIMKFGWLASRFRRSKWWFFSVWLVYELVRACFYGGAAGHAMVQVFGLLAWEIIALITIVVKKPFESNRLNLIMVYLLGFSKVTTVALSSAFDPRFGLSRILTTVIGVVIIVIQGSLTICLMVAIALGAISSYMSLTRYQETFKPEALIGFRTRYFEHVDYKATDKPRPPPPPPPPEPEKPKEPYFTVSSVRRQPKIEDDDPDKDVDEEAYEVNETFDKGDTQPSQAAGIYPHHSRANSVRSRTSTSNLPFGARAHRRSWSIKELPNFSTENIASALGSRDSLGPSEEASKRLRSASMRELPPKDERRLSQGADWQSRRHRRTRSSSTPRAPTKAPAHVIETDEIQPIPSREES